MRDHVRFHSTAFTPASADPGQVNTERYGYTLATWVAARLKERGFDADSPIPEDWGWLLGVAQHGRVIRIGCGNVEGSVSEWVIWLEVVRPGMEHEAAHIAFDLASGNEANEEKTDQTVRACQS